MKIGSEPTVPRTRVTLLPAEPAEFTAFKRDQQAAFALAMVEEMDSAEGPIGCTAALNRSLTELVAISLRCALNTTGSMARL